MVRLPINTYQYLTTWFLTSGQNCLFLFDHQPWFLNMKTERSKRTPGDFDDQNPEISPSLLWGDIATNSKDEEFFICHKPQNSATQKRQLTTIDSPH